MNDYTQILPEAIKHAAECYPRESLGFVIINRGSLNYMRATNKSEDPDMFVSDAAEFAKISSAGAVVALVHSHPNSSSKPSLKDQQSHSVSGLDWIILGLDGETILPAVAKPSLLGREFVHGITDCYSFISEWYSQNLGLDLPDYDRDFEWWSKGQNLYVENFESAGFVEVVGEPINGDVLLMQIGSPVPNHAAVFVDGKIEHHLYGRLSSRDVYGQFYKDRTTHVLRYKRD